MNDVKRGAEAKKEVESFSKEPSKIKAFANGCVKAVRDFANNNDYKNRRKVGSVGGVLSAVGWLSSVGLAAAGAPSEVVVGVAYGSVAASMCLVSDNIIADIKQKRTLVQQAVSKIVGKSKTSQNQVINKMVQKGR